MQNKMNFNRSNSLIFNSSMNKKSKKTSFNATKKKTVVNVNLNRSVLNQTAKFRTKYKQYQRINSEFAIENAKLKVENRSIIQENHLLRQLQVFKTVPNEKMKPLLNRASINLMAVVDDLCSALGLCNGKVAASDIPDETVQGAPKIMEQQMEENSVPEIQEPTQKKFHGQPKQKNAKFDLLEPIDERNFSEILSDISDLPELLFVDQDDEAVVRKANNLLNKKTKTDLSTSSELDNAPLKCNLNRTSFDVDIEDSVDGIALCHDKSQASACKNNNQAISVKETRESSQAGTMFPSSTQNQNEPLTIVSNSDPIFRPLQDVESEEMEQAKTLEIALNMLGEEIQLPTSATKIDSTIQNQTNHSACDMELTDVYDNAPILVNSPLIATNIVPKTLKALKEKRSLTSVKDVIKRNFNESQSFSESEKESDPDFVPSAVKKTKRIPKVNKNFSFFDTKTKKVAPKSKSTRSNKRVEVKKKEVEKEARMHDIFDLSSSFNKTISFIKPYSPRPKKDPSDLANTSASRLSEAGVNEIASDERKIAESKTKSGKSREYHRKTGTLKKTTNNISDSNSDEENKKKPDTIVKRTIRRSKKTAALKKIAMIKSDSNSDEENEKTPDTIVKRNILRSKKTAALKKIAMIKSDSNSDEENEKTPDTIVKRNIGRSKKTGTLKKIVKNNSDEENEKTPDAIVNRSICRSKKTGTLKRIVKNKYDSKSDEENEKTPDTIVKRNISRSKKTAKNKSDSNSDKGTVKTPETAQKTKPSNHIENKSPDVTPFISKENIGKAIKKLKFTRTKPKTKVKKSTEVEDASEEATMSKASRESIQYDPSLPNDLRSPSEGELLVTNDGVSASGRLRRGVPKSYKAIPLNKKMRRND